MFGPDICGSTKRVHVIFTYKGVNHLVKKEIPCKEDEMTHLYTLVVSPDNTYRVKIDGEEAQKGSLEEDWDMLPAKEIVDPEQSKPADWVDSDTMPDPEDTKPEDWDRPAHIPDSEASKPADWDDDMDGEWEAPMVANPEYAPNPLLYRYEDIGALGFDLWQVKSGTIFDNIIITDAPLEAEAFAKETFEITKVAEKKMKDEMDEAKKAEEAAEDAKDKEGKDDEEDDDDVDDEGDEEAKDADADAEPDVEDEDLEEVTGEPGQDGGTESHDEL